MKPLKRADRYFATEVLHWMLWSMSVRILEDNPLFNAGKGSVFTSEGKHELDAAIMDGSTLGAGRITGLTTVKNPVSLAQNCDGRIPSHFLLRSGC
jgi:L-asparaginase / beta-aspartyl-peptidase